MDLEPYSKNGFVKPQADKGQTNVAQHPVNKRLTQ